MADLDDLGFKSITEISVDEGIERIRQIRLSRRMPTKVAKSRPTTTAKPKMSKEEAAELLKLIMGGSK